jgi:hypothetical protein
MKATRSLYGNCVVMSGERVMFRCDQDRVDWYLSMGLATVVSRDPTVLQLTFIPKGPGHDGDPYFLQEFKNRCVACGTDEGLTHHHIVPYCYRKFFPKESYEYGRWFYDVLLLCGDCHHSYEDRAHELKQSIAHEHGVPSCGTTTLTKDESTVMKAAIALDRHRDKIPVDKRERFENIVKAYLGKESLAEVDLKNVVTVLRDGIVTTPAAKIIVAKIKDIDDFATRWRRHFLRHVKPRYLPDLWNPERRIYSEPNNGKAS